MIKLYRDRIYGAYVSARPVPLAPKTVQGLKLRLPYLQNLVRSYFPTESGAAILDLGCGHGAVMYVARQLGYCNIQGVDGSAEQVAAARQLGIEGVQCGDIMDALAHCANASIDCLITFDVIEHFDRNEILTLVDEAKRVLATGGRWIIHVPNGESPFASKMQFWDLTHEVIFTRTSIAQLLLSSGFSTVRCFEDMPIAHGLRSAVRRMLWMCIRSILKFYIAVETGGTEEGQIFTQNLLAVAFK